MTAAADRLAFGTMALVGLYDATADVSRAREALELALERGVRCLHSAWHYGDGRAFDLAREAVDASGRDGVRHVVKIDGNPGRALDGPEGVRRALDRLGATSIDVQLVESREGFADHTTLDDVYADLEAGGPVSELVERLRAEGAVDRVGIEAYDFDHARRAAALDPLDFVVCDMSAMRLVVPPDRVPERVGRGLELMAIRPFAGGWLTDRYRSLADFAPGDFRRDWYWPGERYREPIAEAFARAGLGMVEGALRFVAALPYVGTIVAGMRSPEHVAQALAALAAPPLPAGVVAEISGLFEQPVVLEPD